MRYYVYRRGWNTANQPSASSPERVKVATVDAESEDQACELAAQRVMVYHNQHLYAESADEVDAREADIDSRVQTEQ